MRPLWFKQWYHLREIDTLVKFSAILFLNGGNICGFLFVFLYKKKKSLLWKEKFFLGEQILSLQDIDGIKKEYYSC